MSSNEFKFRGNLGGDPKIVGKTQDGQSIAKFSVSLNQSKKDPITGEYVKSLPQWFWITAFGSKADLASQSLKSGDLVQVEGFIRSNRVEAEGEQPKTFYDFNATTILKIDPMRYSDSAQPSEAVPF